MKILSVGLFPEFTLSGNGKRKRGDPSTQCLAKISLLFSRQTSCCSLEVLLHQLLTIRRKLASASKSLTFSKPSDLSEPDEYLGHGRY